MLLTLKIKIRKLKKQDYLIIKQMCKDSKDLYNSALYEVRQHYFKEGEFLSYFSRYKQMKESSAVKQMKSDFGMHVQQRVDWAFQAFLTLNKMAKNREYIKKVKMPRYLPKNGYYNLFMSSKSFGFDIKHLYFHPTKYICKKLLLNQKYKIKIPFTKKIDGKIKEVQIIPRNNCQYFELAITYEHDETKTNLNLNKDNLLSIDCGLDNFATCLDCQSGRSFILDGRELKSLNRWWNKKVAELKSVYTKHRNSLKKKGVELEKSSKQLIKLSQQRKNQINNHLNQMAAHIIKYCAQNNIGKIIIGDWSSEIKQNIKLGKINNQNFVQMPFSNFKQKLKSKCQIYDLDLIFQEESYTSKCSFLDQESITKHSQYKGKRIHRGLFRTSKGVHINADVNGAANIAVKSKLRDEIYDLVRQSSGFTSNPKRIRLHEIVKSHVKMSALVTYVANEQKQTSLEVA